MNSWKNRSSSGRGDALEDPHAAEARGARTRRAASGRAGSSEARPDADAVQVEVVRRPPRAPPRARPRAAAAGSLRQSSSWRWNAWLRDVVRARGAHHRRMRMSSCGAELERDGRCSGSCDAARVRSAQPRRSSQRVSTSSQASRTGPRLRACAPFSSTCGRVGVPMRARRGRRLAVRLVAALEPAALQQLGLELGDHLVAAGRRRAPIDRVASPRAGAARSRARSSTSQRMRATCASRASASFCSAAREQPRVERSAASPSSSGAPIVASAVRSAWTTSARTRASGCMIAGLQQADDGVAADRGEHLHGGTHHGRPADRRSTAPAARACRGTARRSRRTSGAACGAPLQLGHDLAEHVHADLAQRPRRTRRT